LRRRGLRCESRGAAIARERVQHRCSVSSDWWFSSRLLSPTQERSGEGRAVLLSKISASARATDKPNETFRNIGHGLAMRATSMNLAETKVSSAAEISYMIARWADSTAASNDPS
jgi:hypothetical protein